AWWLCSLARKDTRTRFRAWLMGTWAGPREADTAPDSGSESPMSPAAWCGRFVKQGMLFAVAAALLVLVPLHTLRWHQDRQLRALFTAYEAAEREAVWPVVARVDATSESDGKRV